MHISDHLALLPVLAHRVTDSCRYRADTRITKGKQAEEEEEYENMAATAEGALLHS